MGELPSSKWSRGVAWLGDRVVTEAQNAALPNTLELEGDIGWEGQSRLFSVHFQTSILVPFMQHRCVSAALTFSSTHVSRSEMVEWVSGWRTCCTDMIFPTQQGTLSVHSTATPTLVTAKSPLSWALPAKCNNLHLSQKEKKWLKFPWFFHT